MRKFLFFIPFICILSQNVFAVDCPDTFVFGEDKIDQFRCQVATWDEFYNLYDITATYLITDSFTMARNNGVSPECVVNDPKLTSETSSDDRLAQNKVVKYCQDRYPDTNFIKIPYGCDKTGVNHCQSELYRACFYIDHTTHAWTSAKGQHCDITK
jgi:hypothetical protein